MEYLFITIASRFTLTRVVAPDMILTMSQTELFNVLNWEQTNDLCSSELFEIELFDQFNGV